MNISYACGCFDRGKQDDVIILTKDKDFIDLVGR